MFGNLQGWLISAVLAVLVLLPVSWLVRISQMSPPSGIGRDPANLMALSLPVDPDEAVPIFTSDDDARTLYTQVISAWSDDAERAAQRYEREGQGPLPPPLQWLVDARHCRRMTLFAADLPAVVNYDSDHPKLEAIFSAGRWTYRAGVALISRHDEPAATECLQAAFALGRRLFEERIVFDECQKGMALMANSAAALASDSPQWDKLARFRRGLDFCTNQRLIPIWQVISSINQDVIARTAGDVAVFAERSQERMWRVEAALKLGRYRFDAGTAGDQLGAARVLRRLLADPDPAVAAAARAGLNLDIQTYRMIH
jgi:hypothetical protein